MNGAPRDGAASGPGATSRRCGRISGPRSLTLGAHRITYVPDGSVQLLPGRWFPDSRASDWRTLSCYLDDDGFLSGSIGALAVQHGDRTMLIDAGFGRQRIDAARTIPHIGRIEGGQLPSALAAAGLAPDAIETVALTHAHDDHVGWAFARRPDGAGELFPRAVIAASAAEWRAWQPPVPATARGRTRVIRHGEEIFPGVTAWLTPGHSAGHTCYVIASGGMRMIAFGDLMHPPLQVSRAGWRVDLDGVRAERARRSVLAELGREDTLGFGTHFADVVFGRVTRSSNGPVWSPLP